MSLPFNPDSHNEYTRLLHEYLDAKQSYELDDSKENWYRLQEALLRLKRCTDRMDIKRRMQLQVRMSLTGPSVLVVPVTPLLINCPRLPSFSGKGY